MAGMIWIFLALFLLLAMFSVAIMADEEMSSKAFEFYFRGCISYRWIYAIVFISMVIDYIRPKSSIVVGVQQQQVTWSQDDD